MVFADIKTPEDKRSLDTAVNQTIGDFKGIRFLRYYLDQGGTVDPELTSDADLITTEPDLEP